MKSFGFDNQLVMAVRRTVAMSSHATTILHLLALLSYSVQLARRALKKSLLLSLLSLD